MAMPRTWTDTQLVTAAAESISLRQTVLALGLRVTGGQYDSVRKHIERLSIDTSHWLGQAHYKGRTFKMSSRKPLHELKSRGSVRRRIIVDGLLDYECSVCKLSEWLGKPLSLVLDHINGVADDHRLENLRFICPNCDSQSDTFAGRNTAHAKARRNASV